MDRIYLTEGMNSLRQKWEFEYTARVLAYAAHEQKNYRDKRVLVWTEKKEEIMAKIRTSGLEIHESVAEKMSGTNYSNALRGHGVSISVDDTLQQDINEAMEKIKTHRELAQSYDAWIQMLEANPEARLKLTHADWMFFFGR